MRFSVLGSGSTGNATLVTALHTSLMVDAGFSGKELKRRLEAVEVAPEDIQGIVITHEHGDHTQGAGIFSRRYGTPLWMTARTRDACSRFLKGTEDVRTYRPGYPFEIGGLRLEPFITVHDAVDPVAIAVVDQGTGLRLGIATDMGRPSVQIRHALKRCDALVVESNYDEVMLWAGAYPPSVKARIASSHGHLSNQAAARFLTDLMNPRLSAVILAHLSAESNTPELARSVGGKALRNKGFRGLLDVSAPDGPTALVDLDRVRSRWGAPQLSLFGRGPD
ncbi:MAG: MBL fold metallo-hydrolase [Gemmatimonadetes bacterium]|nr:MBL fold metallo-hydrolase [Gemmatimonadota bacterium]